MKFYLNAGVVQAMSPFVSLVMKYIISHINTKTHTIEKWYKINGRYAKTITMIMSILTVIVQIVVSENAYIYERVLFYPCK